MSVNQKTTALRQEGTELVGLHLLAYGAQGSKWLKIWVPLVIWGKNRLKQHCHILVAPLGIRPSVL